MLAPVNTTVPVLAASPTLSAPVPEMIPLRVAVLPAVAAMVLVVPEAKEMALLIVLVPLANKVPPFRVTAPVERLVFIAPAVNTDKVPPVIVVPPP